MVLIPSKRDVAPQKGQRVWSVHKGQVIRGTVMSLKRKGFVTVQIDGGRTVEVKRELVQCLS